MPKNQLDRLLLATGWHPLILEPGCDWLEPHFRSQARKPPITALMRRSKPTSNGRPLIMR
jgi:hypothetical protein